MKLTELKLLENERLVRDSSFGHFGMVADVAAHLLVPVSSRTLSDAALANPNVAAIVCTPEFQGFVPDNIGLCVSERPLDVVYRNHILKFDQKLQEPQTPTQIALSAIIHASAFVAPENVIIGERTIIGPLAVVERGTIIGHDCNIGPGVVIGGNGFEVREIDGQRRVVPHGGGVRLGNRVELQANTSVTRSLFSGFTEIGDDSATDNLVHVAHNVRIGKRCRLAAAAMIAGSTTLGDDVWVGPNATVSNGLNIGHGAQITLGAVVVKDVAPGEKVSGNFAIEHRAFMKFFRSILSQQRPQ